MIRTNILIITAVISLTSSFMSHAMTCPGNFNIINPGDSVTSVIAQCGKPDKQIDSSRDNPNVPQEWNYFIPQTVAMYNPMQQAQGSLKATVTFDDTGKAINISVNGIGVGASTVCGAPVQLGDSLDSVKSACGTPAFVNKQQGSAGGGGGLGSSDQPSEIKTTELDYNSTNPPTKLMFENGKLLSP